MLRAGGPCGVGAVRTVCGLDAPLWCMACLGVSFLPCVVPAGSSRLWQWRVDSCVWVGVGCSTLWGYEDVCVTMSDTNRARRLVCKQVTHRLPTRRGPLVFFVPLVVYSLMFRRSGLLFSHFFCV
ncbi:hypothetical protein TcCL_ESM11646 [Trypanosoma cruzi]|nr:hypothetical protein TcCL_ESM11646 [Trypanosoma cruzi]